jgi:predicted aconitase with swiveling domain
MQELALAALVQRGIAPRGIITSDADTRLITAALFCEMPLMDKLEKNPLEAITTGDFVRMNADKEIVEIQR